ncbi:MAG TPA: DCL family protein [Kiritimatiellia bacterium]|nr:DCL family protein [Saprospiraceae bacterium]HMP00482.1 DCL family protein [Kiritimatiellia bacterium]
MPRRSKYKFGSNEFTSQDAVKKHCAEIRRKYGLGGTVIEPEDISLLSDLIACHVEHDSKVGCGIARFYVDAAPEHQGECFWIERKDGSRTDFGVPACLVGIARLNHQSLRMAVKYQIDAFMSSKLAEHDDTFKSEYSGASFPISEAVVDHTVTFQSIIEQFFSPRGIDITKELLTISRDQKSEPVWRDPEMLSEFLEFHEQYPLRLVHWRENLSEIKKDGG